MKKYVGILALIMTISQLVLADTPPPLAGMPLGSLDPHEKYLLETPLAGLENGELLSDRRALLRASVRLHAELQKNKADVEEYKRLSKAADEAKIQRINLLGELPIQFWSFGEPTDLRDAEDNAKHLSENEELMKDLAANGKYKLTEQLIYSYSQVGWINACVGLFKKAEGTHWNGSIYDKIQAMRCPESKAEALKEQTRLSSLNSSLSRQTNAIKMAEANANAARDAAGEKVGLLVNNYVAVKTKMSRIDKRLKGDNSPDSDPSLAAANNFATPGTGRTSN